MIVSSVHRLSVVVQLCAAYALYRIVASRLSPAPSDSFYNAGICTVTLIHHSQSYTGSVLTHPPTGKLLYVINTRGATVALTGGQKIKAVHACLSTLPLG